MSGDSTVSNSNKCTNVSGKSGFTKILPGIFLVIVIGLIAHFLGGEFPLIGGAVFAIVLGILVKNYIGVPERFNAGISYTLQKLLKLAIVLLGFGLSFSQIINLGMNSIIIVVLSVSLGILFTLYLAKLLGLEGNIPLLVGVGTGICGATAIATTGPVIKAKEEEIAYAVNTIFAFNVLAVMVYPFIGLALSIPDHYFGIWAGAAIHDTSSVVAAGYAYSDQAGDASVVVKLIRTLMLVPVALIISIYFSLKAKKNQNTNQQGEVKISKIFPYKIFPYFILIFAAAATFNTFFPLPETFISATNFTAKFIILMVMASVGLGTDFKKIKSVGVRPLIVGLTASIMIGGISLVLIYMLF